jgi:hypothetical protein
MSNPSATMMPTSIERNLMFSDLSTDEYYNDILIWDTDQYIPDEPEDEEEMDEDYWSNMAEDSLMEHYLGLDC